MVVGLKPVPESGRHTGYQLKTGGDFRRQRDQALDELIDVLGAEVKASGQLALRAAGIGPVPRQVAIMLLGGLRELTATTVEGGGRISGINEIAVQASIALLRPRLASGPLATEKDHRQKSLQFEALPRERLRGCPQVLGADDGREVQLSYSPKLAAALSGATGRQLSHWRRQGADRQPILAPELSTERPILYSFRDVVALRTCVRLRQEASLQKIRRALDSLRLDLGLRDHLSSYQLVTDGSSIYLADEDHAVDLVERTANVVIHQIVDVLQPFYVQGRQIPDLLDPRAHVQVDPAVRGGEPVINGTRIPYEDVSALMRDGVAAEDVQEFFPHVTADAARDAYDFASYVDSYVNHPEAAA